MSGLSGMDASQWFPICGALLAALLAGGVGWSLQRLPSWRLPSRGLRVSAMAVAGLLAGMALLVAAVLIFFDVNYTRHLAPLAAPDGRHVAITSYTINNGTGVDEVEVAIRTAWSPYGYRVYTGPAKYVADGAHSEPEVRWIDGGHLEIQFHAYDGGPVTANGQGCSGAADGVVIRCMEERVHWVR